MNPAMPGRGFLAPVCVLLRLAVALSLVGSAPADAQLDLGVTTHFGQKWPERIWPMLESLPPVHVRDAVRWVEVEKVRGRYDFTPATTAHIDRVCAGGRKVLLSVLLRHPLYDAGQTVHTPAGRAAVANWTRALALRFGDCLIGFEIGNEINIKANYSGPAAVDLPGSYMAILQAVRAAVKPVAPNAKILAGSTNAIATGFLERLFEAGLLEVADALVIHPYRRGVENIDWEVERLRAAMLRHGKPIPIVATEFSLDTRDEQQGASFMAQMLVGLAASGVREAWWYALVDQQAFPTMGLFTLDGRAKPAAEVFRRFATQWKLMRPPEPMAAGEPALKHYRLAPDLQVMWGAPRSFSLRGTGTFRDVAGRAMPKPNAVSMTPFFLQGSGTLVPGPAQILADSLLDYGRPVWHYWGRRGNVGELTLGGIDWTWTSFIGHPTMRPSVVNQRSLSAFGTITLGLRWTAPRAVDVRALACLGNVAKQGTAAQFQLFRNGALVAETAVGDTRQTLDVPIRAVAGDRIDFAVRSVRDAGGVTLPYRFQIATQTAPLPVC